MQGLFIAAVGGFNGSTITLAAGVAEWTGFEADGDLVASVADAADAAIVGDEFHGHSSSSQSSRASVIYESRPEEEEEEAAAAASSSSSRKWTLRWSGQKRRTARPSQRV